MSAEAAEWGFAAVLGRLDSGERQPIAFAVGSAEAEVPSMLGPFLSLNRKEAQLVPLLVAHFGLKEAAKIRVVIRTTARTTAIIVRACIQIRVEERSAPERVWTCEI